MQIICSNLYFGMSIKRLGSKSISAMFGKGITNADYHLFEGNVVSFDVFDTLVKRSCGNPEGVFKIVENKYNVEYSQIPITNFKSLRIKCEKEARKCSNSEITIDEIYDRVGIMIGFGLADLLKNIEIETELEQSIPNDEVYMLFRHMIDKGERVFVISDMYLSEIIITQVLEKCGISGFEKLYVSSEYGMMKRDGSLFEMVISENQIDRRHMIHVGDHPLADFIIPIRRCGIRSYLYKSNGYKA